MTPQLVKQLNQLRLEATFIVIIVVVIVIIKPLYVMQLLGIIIFLQEEHSLERFEELNHAFALVVPLQA